MIEKLSVIVAVSCLSAALTIARPSVASPSPAAQPNPRAIHLQVDVAELGEKGIGLDKVIRDHVGPRLEAANFELVDVPQAAIVVRLRLRVLESSPYDYGVHFEFIDGTTREPAVEWADCHGCIDAKLMPILDERLPALLLALDERGKRVAAESEAEAEAASGGEGETGEEAPVEDEPVDTRPRPKPITGLGIGGAIVAGLGVGAVIGGGVELSRGLIVEEATTDERKRIDHRPPGYVLVGVGAAAIVAGAVMLGVDLAAQAKKRKAHASAARTQIVPLLGPESVGLGVGGQF